MKRTFQRLNVVRETEDNAKAAKYLEEGYVEITEPLQEAEEKPAERRGKAGKKAEKTAEDTTTPPEPEKTDRGKLAPCKVLFSCF